MGGNVFDQLASQQTQQSAPPAPPPSISDREVEAPAVAGPALNPAIPPTPRPVPQGNAFDQMAAAQKKPGSMAENQKTWWDEFKEASTRGAIQQIKVGPHTNLGQVGAGIDEAIQKVIDKETAQNHPWRASIARAFSSSLGAFPQFANDMSSAVNLGLYAAGGIEARAVKAALGLTNLYFAYRGSQQIDFDRLPNETVAGYAQRNLQGISMLVGGTTGAASDAVAIGDIQRAVLRHSLGVDGDLEAKVNDAVNQAKDIKQRAADRASGVLQESAKQGLTEQFEQSGRKVRAQQTVQQAREQIPSTIGEMMRDALPVVISEQARVDQPFELMKEMATTPVSDNASVRASMVDTMLSHGIQEHEIPSTIFNALADKGITEEGEPIEGVRPGEPGYERLASMVGEEAPETKPVSFADLTRVRGDVWDAMQSAQDSRVRGALGHTLDSVTKIQEDYAVKNNFGGTNRTEIIDGKPKTFNDMYRGAKLEYTKFKRELGSKLMSDFTKAETMRQQRMVDALSKLMSPKDGATVRDLLQMAGVDTRPFDELVNRKAMAEQVLKEKELSGASGVREGEKRAAAVVKTRQKEVSDLGQQNQIVPGRSNFKLAGKSTEDIARDRLNALGQMAQKQGIANPYHTMLIILGLARLPFSPVSGGFLVARGVAMGQSRGWAASMLQKPSFQDWLIRESGVHPANLTMVDKMRGALKRLAQSGVLARTAANAQ